MIQINKVNLFDMSLKGDRLISSHLATIVIVLYFQTSFAMS